MYNKKKTLDLHRVVHLSVANDLPELLYNLVLAARRTSNRKVHTLLQCGLPVARVSADHLAAGLAEDTPSSADIPRPAAALPVHVHLTGSHGSNVQGSRAQRAQGVDHGAAGLLGGGQLPEHLRLEVEVGAVTVGTPFNGDESIAETFERTGCACEGQLLRSSALDAGHVGALALDRGKEQVLPGVVDDADDGATFDGEAEGDAGVGEGVDEVGGSYAGSAWRPRHNRRARTVNGVDNESRLRANTHARLVRLLAHKGNVRKRRGKARRDHLLDVLIRLGDDVDRCRPKSVSPFLFWHRTAEGAKVRTCGGEASIRTYATEEGRIWSWRTVELGAGVELGRVGGEHHPAGLVGEEDHFVVDGLQVDSHCGRD